MHIVACLLECVPTLLRGEELADWSMELVPNDLLVDYVDVRENRLVEQAPGGVARLAIEAAAQVGHVLRLDDVEGSQDPVVRDFAAVPHH
jgi:hypothetical protein